MDRWTLIKVATLCTMSFTIAVQHTGIRKLVTFTESDSAKSRLS